MKFLSSYILILFVFLSIVSCENKTGKVPVEHKYVGKTQGTYYSITYFAEDTINLLAGIDSVLARFDSTFSVYKPNSIISLMNKENSEVLADSMFAVAWEESLRISELTNGAFDVTVAPLIELWGFGLKNRDKVTQKQVDSLLKFIGYKNVKLENNKLIKNDERNQINLNGIAQGYAVDVVASFLQSKGIKSYLVDIGGEAITKGFKPENKLWKIAIEKPAKNPEDEREIQQVVLLTDKAISTSGNYRKYYVEDGKRFSHTIDPATGFPVTHSLLSVSVISDKCITADALCTAFMVMGFEKSKEFVEQHKDIAAYFIFSNEKSENEVFYNAAFAKYLEK